MTGESVRTTMPSPTGKSTCGLKLRHLLDFHQAHAAGGLQRISFDVAERRHFDAVLARRLDHQRAWRSLDRPSVDGEIYQISHFVFYTT